MTMQGDRERRVKQELAAARFYVGTITEIITDCVTGIINVVPAVLADLEKLEERAAAAEIEVAKQHADYRTAGYYRERAEAFSRRACLLVGREPQTAPEDAS